MAPKIICVCLEVGIFLIPTELQIELGQSRSSGKDRREYVCHLLFTWMATAGDGGHCWAEVIVFVKVAFMS